MITKCKFNPLKDIQETIPDLAVSIKEALATGIVKDTSTSTPYSKMKSTDEVGHYLTDAIDIALEQRRVAGIMSAQAASNEANFNQNPE